MPTEQSQPKLDWNQLIREALDTPGDMMNVYNRLHEYSYTNTLLFLQQGVREPVASYHRWRSVGRHVLRGAHAKNVIVPLLVPEPRAEPAPANETLDEKRARVARLIGFKVVRGVFALSDTDGPELPEVKLLQWDQQTALEKLKITLVPFQHTNGNVQGYSIGREIAINPVSVYPHKTLMHELAHVVLGHTVASIHGEYATHQGIKEFQAEATAYLVMNELEQLTTDMATVSRGYIQHWLDAEQPTDREIRLVFAATDQILRSGRRTTMREAATGTTKSDSGQ